MKNHHCMLIVLVGLGSYSLTAHTDTLFDGRMERWKSLAASGDKKALYKMGRSYEHGRNVKRNLAKSIQYYQKSAALGYHKAEYRLAYIYYTQDGKYRNYRKAYQLFLHSAQRGYPPSQYYAAKMLYEGKGVQRDYSKALLWAKRAQSDSVHGSGSLISRIQAIQQREFKEKHKRKRQVKKPVKLAKLKSPAKRPIPRDKPGLPRPEQPGARQPAQDTQKLLVNTLWTLKGKPALKMPSLSSACQIKSDRIRCVSKNLSVQNDDYKATYEVISILSNFADNGSFKIRYKLKYLSVTPAQQELIGDPADIPQPGLQKTTNSMRCKVEDSKRIKCFSDNLTVVRYDLDKNAVR